LHQKLTDRVPESVMSKIRELRQAWYSWRFQSSTEAI
jgi:hypothetical protein